MGDRTGEGTTLNNLGLVYNNLGRSEEALRYYEQALAISTEVGDRAGEGITLGNIGILLYASERYAEAEERLYQSIAVFESLRAGDLNEADKVALFETQLDNYEALQQVLIAQGKTAAALVVAERGRARVLAESLALRALEPSTPAILPDAPSLAEIRRIAQSQNATLVSYSIIDSGVGEPALYIWVVQPTGTITFQEVNISRLDQRLSDLVDTTRQALNVRSRNEAEAIISLTPEALETQRQRQSEALQTLHQLLIDPIAPYLPDAPTERIIIIPHQSLYLVPFPALMDANGSYLIEQHTLLTAPSIQILDLAPSQRSLNAAALRPEEVLLVGNPIMPSVWNPNSGQPQQLSNLPGTETEVVAIQALLGAAPLLWDVATETNVRAQMPNAQVIHLATHGLLDYGDPAETGILDFPGAIALAPGNGEDGLLTSAEILPMNLRAELVVLSACDTGRGRITGDGVVGLSRAFMQAGVPSLIVSLWKVPDDATAFLMTQFYENWQTEGDRAQALRQAMLTTMEQYPDPLNWAAFTLVGQAE